MSFHHARVARKSQQGLGDESRSILLTPPRVIKVLNQHRDIKKNLPKPLLHGPATDIRMHFSITAISVNFPLRGNTTPYWIRSWLQLSQCTFEPRTFCLTSLYIRSIEQGFPSWESEIFASEGLISQCALLILYVHYQHILYSYKWSKDDRTFRAPWKKKIGYIDAAIKDSQ